MNIAIVGSRRRSDKQLVVDYVNSLDETAKVISGGCEGVDSWAIEAAMARGLKWQVFFPDLSDARTYYERCNRYYSRNHKVVLNSDMVVAFVSKDRKGGTENTISWAKKENKPVIIVNEGDVLAEILPPPSVVDDNQNTQG
jgi:predicted Rossmann fold nucleotide-binding protein DprA/Smf involved in DNA uptake